MRDTPSITAPSNPPLWLLVLVTFAGTLAMHMFVPALGPAARELGTTAPAIQSAISLYILGLALGQLVYGPVSDQVGLYAFVAAAPFLFGERFGQSVNMVGIDLFMLMVGISLGNLDGMRL